MTRSIRTKLLLILGLTFLVSTAAILYFSMTATKRVIISENEKAYKSQLDVLMRVLENKQVKLASSGMEGLFADGYKKSTVAELSDLYYAGNPAIYPFIIDNTGLVVLHPQFSSGSSALVSEVFIPIMLSTKNGSQKYRFQGDKKWMIYRTFEPWQWTVGYAMKSTDKFSAVKAAAKRISGIMVACAFVSLTLIAFTLSRIVGPIRVLAEDAARIGDGDYTHSVTVLKGHDEISQLATSFRTMAGNIRNRDAEIRTFNEKLEERVRERTADLRASEERFRDVAFSSADWIWEIDATGHYTYSSGKVRQIVGYEHEEVLGKTTCDLIVEEEQPLMRGVFQQSAQLKKSINDIETWHLTKTGDRVCLATNGVPLFGEDDTLLGYRGVHRDITRRKQYEEALKSAKEAAEEATRMKSEFLANMSHEIRTPMNGIMGMSGLLADTELTKEQFEYTQTITSSADALLCIINDILDFSKIEAGKLEFEFINFDLQACVEDVAEMLAIKAHEKGLELGAVIEPSVPLFIKGDPGRLRQVLMNLSSNAIKFTDQGQIVIRVFPEKVTDTSAELRFSITDTGVGIPAERQSRLFKSFSQVDASTTRKYGGTGLGLAISKQLVEMMQGGIHVESAEGQGSTFWFTAVFERQAVDENQEVVIPKDIKGKRVLVVDDNSVNCEILTSYLKIWGCRYSSVFSAPEALLLMYKAVKIEDPYDLAIIDHMMPDMSGEELAISIKANLDLDHTKMIMLTSRGLRGDAQMARKLGYDAYLTKPIRRKNLYDAILALFGKVIKAGHEGGQDGLITQHSLKEKHIFNAHVLVVDDNVVNQKVASLMLSKFGCRIDTVSNGKEAVDAFKLIPYDIIFMDVQMPVLDGCGATRSIRELENVQPKEPSGQGKPIPVIAMTANAMKGDREKCLAAGMDDYLAKPVNPDGLRAKLAQWLPDIRRAEKTEGATIG